VIFVPGPDDIHTKELTSRLIAVHGSVVDIVFPSGALPVTKVTPPSDRTMHRYGVETYLE
jgi:hypothetical protein